MCNEVKSELEAAEPTPDGLGAWQGGTAALKGANNWVSLKSRASRTASAKNTPGIDYPSKINETHQKDYIAPRPYYVDENNKVWKYNPTTDDWDIPVLDNPEAADVPTPTA